MGFDLRATATGHKRPDLVTANPICFIHTDAAIFAIDDDGVCCYVTSVSGEVPRNANRCRGAEYVACLDLASSDGLVAEPRIGSTGLFVGRGATQKMALLRTGPITAVEYVDEEPDSGDVSQVQPVDALQRQLEEELEELDAIELEPFEIVEEPVAPASTPSAPISNVTPFTLKAPSSPPRRSSSPASSAPSMMDPSELLEAALRLTPQGQQTPPAGRAPSPSDIDLDWAGVDPRKTRVGMPIVKLT
jgi:hypothetical protein